MRKVILLLCVVALLVSVVGAANASAGNWILTIRAYSNSWTGADKVVDLGVKGAAPVNSIVSGSPGSSKAESVGWDGTNGLTTATVASVTTANEWLLKIGQGTAAFASLNINLYNQQSNLGAERALDTSFIYKLKDSQGVAVATFSTVANRPTGLADGVIGTAGGWFDVSVLMKGANWANSTSDRGWYYVDTTPTTSATWPDLETYKFSFELPGTPNTPEPGSFLALGTGLVGLAGFAIRRRKA